MCCSGSAWVGAAQDRPRQGEATVYQALKSGGVYALVDHSAKDSSDVKDIELHRIDEQFLINEVQKAGFTLVARSSALRHPASCSYSGSHNLNGISGSEGGWICHKLQMSPSRTITLCEICQDTAL